VTVVLERAFGVSDVEIRRRGDDERVGAEGCECVVEVFEGWDRILRMGFVAAVRARIKTGDLAGLQVLKVANAAFAHRTQSHN